VYGGAGEDILTDYTRAKSYLYGGDDNDVLDATRNEAGSNPFVPDYVSGNDGFDVATVNREDIVSSSTEQRIYQ
jgi:hypothetical protein